MEDYTIAETYTLPSKGKIYDREVTPDIKLRSMTTVEEMRRLSHTDFPYKTLCDIIDACMVDGVDKVGISSYDMHLGDYQFLLHRLRVVTYGSEYPLSSICPICGKTNKRTINLDEIPLLPFNPDEEKQLQEFKEMFNIVLPKCGKKIKLRFQTPRDLDEINKEEKQHIEQFPDDTLNNTYLLNIIHSIDTVDGKKVNPTSLGIFLKKLPQSDTNLIVRQAAKINDKVGIDTKLENVCSNPRCGAKYKTFFRITNEFFGPSGD